MKETIANMKKVYSYGKKYKKNLIVCMFCSMIFICINVILPILGSKQLLFLTENVFDELIYTSVMILIIMIISNIVMVLLKKIHKYFLGVQHVIYNLR